MKVRYKMTKGGYYADRRHYCERALGDVFEPFSDFNGIDYVRESQTDAEYIRMKSLIGTMVYFNITALSKDQICKDVVYTTMVQSDTLPESCIQDVDEIRKIAPLFKGKC